MKWIDATDLDQWADRRDSQALLPEIIRRLVHATVSAPRRIVFGSGESVQLGGWDGYVELPTGTAFVPEGISCWEMGSTSQPKGKADDDYDKRTANPLGIDRSNATFIFVTPRRWGGKTTWAQEHKALGQWLDVRTYDADDLEAWLMQAPGVGAWLAIAINKYPEHVRSIDDFWNEFANLTNPTLTAGVLLAGRDHAVELVHAWLRNTPALLHVRAATTNEAVAFLAACIDRLPAEKQEPARYRTLVTDDPETLRALSATPESLTIAYQGDDTMPTISAVQHGHRILVPITGGGERLKPDIVLSRQPPEAFARALIEAGLSEERSWALVRETGRSITAVQRRIATVAARIPAWAVPPAAHDLAMMLFAGSWDESCEADRTMLVELVGKPYEEISKISMAWSQGVDAPLRHTGNLWNFVALRDAWDQLCGFVSRGDLERFLGIAERAFSLEDPRLELALDERWLATIRHKRTLHSLELREGIARSLVLVSVLGSEGVISGRPQDLISFLIRRVLSPTAGWQRWYSVAGVLELLAEAAPDEFLGALHEHLRPQAPELIHLFDEEQGGLFSHTEHTHLLWALEVLAWQPEYLGSVTLALGRLASLDPGGQIHNRPRNTLRSIFLLWHPNTTASLQQRFQAIDLLLEREPAIGWDLVCALLPKTYDAGETNAQPQWRTIVAPPRVTRGEHYQGILGILERARRAAGMQSNRLALLINGLGQWPPEAREALLAQLHTFAQTSTDNGERILVWEALRNFINHHRSFPDAQWALPGPMLEAFEDLRQSLTPADAIARYSWLFADWWPTLDRPRADLMEHDAYLQALRKEAIEATLRECGIDGVIALGRAVKYPGLVGAIIADIATDADLQSFLVTALRSTDQSDRIIGMGCSSRCYERGGEQWLGTIFGNSLSDDVVTSVLLSLPSGRSIWDRATALGRGIEERYWREARVWVANESLLDDLVFALEHLLNAGRPFVALDLCSHQANRPSGALLLRVVDGVAESLSKGVTIPPGYEFLWALEQVFRALQASDISEAEIARREWTYLPLLARGHNMPPLVLHRVLARDPALFAEVVCAAFRPHHRDDNEPISEDDRTRAGVAYECLSSWTVVPGSEREGNIDAAILNSWVDEARRLCATNDRAAIGDQQIGHILGFAPVGPDGIWPARDICALLERVAAEEIERGIFISIHNQRGVFSKGLTDGGAQERALAARYRTYADAVAIPFPRTARMLRRIADGYEADAHDEDIRAEQRDLG